jgi:hypothetical protein
MHSLGRLVSGASALLAVSSGSPLAAAGTATFLNAPAKAGIAPVKLAGQFELKLHLPEGRGLARLLIDAGVVQDDAAAAAKLAAGRLDDDKNDCFATVSVERAAGGELNLVRVMLTTDDRRTIIERRGDELAIASESPIAKQPRLI